MEFQSTPAWLLKRAEFRIYLIKTDSMGNRLWHKTFGGDSWDEACSIQALHDGGFVIVGGTESYGSGSEDLLLIKIDSMGTTVWEKTFGGSDSDWGYSVLETGDGGYIIAGGSSSYSDDGTDDVWLIKVNITSAPGVTAEPEVTGEPEGEKSVREKIMQHKW